MKSGRILLSKANTVPSALCEAMEENIYIKPDVALEINQLICDYAQSKAELPWLLKAAQEATLPKATQLLAQLRHYYLKDSLLDNKEANHLNRKI